MAVLVLAERLPRFDPDAALLKVVALNALYGTPTYGIVRMAT